MTLAKRSDTINGVPAVVRQTMQYLREKGISEGIFRKSGIMTEIEEFKQANNQGTIVQLNKATDEHVVSGLMKLFFRELPIPLIPFSHYQAVIDMTEQPNQSEDQLVSALRSLLASLPKPHLDLLASLCKFLNEMAEHKDITMMDYSNLAIVFASNILRSPTETLEATLKYGSVNKLVDFIITNADELFDNQLNSGPSSAQTKGKDDATWLSDLRRHIKIVKQQQEREEQRQREKDEATGSDTVTATGSIASPLKISNPLIFDADFAERERKHKRAISTGSKINSKQRKSVKKEKIIKPKYNS